MVATTLVSSTPAVSVMVATSVKIPATSSPGAGLSMAMVGPAESALNMVYDVRVVASGERLLAAVTVRVCVPSSAGSKRASSKLTVARKTELPAGSSVRSPVRSTPAIEAVTVPLSGAAPVSPVATGAALTRTMMSTALAIDASATGLKTRICGPRSRKVSFSAELVRGGSARSLAVQRTASEPLAKPDSDTLAWYSSCTVVG